MGFAGHQFELAVPQADGLPLREHLEAYERQRGRPHPLLAEGPTLRSELGPLWEQFLELHSSRGFTGYGPAPITYQDIDCFLRVTGGELEAWEVDAIRRADHEYFKSLPKPKGKEN